MESQNHRMVEVGCKGPRGVQPVQPPCSSRATLSSLPRIISVWDRHFTTSQCNLQSPSQRKMFPDVGKGPLVNVASCPAAVLFHRKESGSVLFTCSVQIFMHIDNSPWIFSSPGWAAPVLSPARVLPAALFFYVPKLTNIFSRTTYLPKTTDATAQKICSQKYINQHK